MKTFSHHPRSVLAAAAAGLVIAAAACGSPALVPAARLGQVTIPQQAQAVSAQPSGASAAAAPADSNGSSASETSAGSSPAAGEVQIAFDAGNSQAQYQTQEQLAGRNLPNTAVGTTTGVSGQIVLTQTGQLDASASKITVDLTSLKSDESMRDSFVQRNTLQTSQYPQAVFVPTAITGLQSPLPTSGSATFQLTGNLTVHGVTKPVTWAVAASFDGQQVSGKATAPFTITEFGMALPKAGPVLSVQDASTLELDFTNAALSSAS